jgi:hypothetical protein
VTARRIAATGSVVAAISAIALPATASACSCAPLTRDSFERADAAAVLRLDQVEPDAPIHGGFQTGPGKFTYTVREVLSGRGRLSRDDEITIDSKVDGAACGLEGVEGEKYGVLLYRRKGEWTSHLCAITSPKELRRLARGGRSADGC